MANGSYKQGIAFKNFEQYEQEQKDIMIKDIKGLSKCGLSETAQQNVLDEIAWKYTETISKFAGCVYWSEDAFALAKSIFREGMTIGDFNVAIKEYVTHEHIVPRSVFIKDVIDKIKGGTSFSKDDIAAIDKALKCCITHREVDDPKLKPYNSKMPTSTMTIFDKNFKEWERYKETGISCVKVDWKIEKVKRSFIIENMMEANS